MKTIWFICTGLVLLGLGQPADAQTLPKGSSQPAGGKRASRAVPQPSVEKAHPLAAYPGSVVVNPQELGEKMRTLSRPANNVTIRERNLMIPER